MPDAAQISISISRRELTRTDETRKLGSGHPDGDFETHDKETRGKQESEAMDRSPLSRAWKNVRRGQR